MCQKGGERGGMLGYFSNCVFGGGVWVSAAKEEP